MKNCNHALPVCLLLVAFGCSSSDSSATNAVSGASAGENVSSEGSASEAASNVSTPAPVDLPEVTPDTAAGIGATPVTGESDLKTEPVPVEPVTSGAGAPKEVSLELLEWDEIDRIIKSHRGKVVVVDCWATYCVPCRKEFPGLVRLSQELSSDVVCISVSLDEAADRDAALDFLIEQNSLLTNLLCTTDTDTLYDQILKVGSVPAIFVYGRDGTIARTFTGASPDGGEYTYAGHITPFVRELVSQQVECSAPAAAAGYVGTKRDSI